MTLQYRSGGKGYWVALLLPLALYFTRYQNKEYYNFSVTSSVTQKSSCINTSRNPESLAAEQDGKQDVTHSLFYLLADPSMIILIILIKNSLILTVVHKFYSEVDYKTVLSFFQSYNTFISTLILSCTLAVNGFLYEKFACLAVNCAFPVVFFHLIKYYPKSFTFGEALTVTQGFCYAFWSSVVSVPVPPKQWTNIGDETLVILLSQVGLLAVVLLSRLLVVTKRPWSFAFMEEFLCLWSKCCLAVMVYRMDFADFLQFIQWIVEFYFATGVRKSLFVYWASLFFLALSFVAWTNFTGRQTSTMDRKYFHFLVVAVYLPGILMDYNMLFLSSVALTYIFILVELIRFLDHSGGIGKWIDEGVGKFRDKQDEGDLLITHIYLLAGCSMPVWLQGVKFTCLGDNGWNLLCALSGVLSVGVGDTFASIGGSAFGKTIWEGNRKSVEGTICSIVSQIIVLGCITASGLCPMSFVVFLVGLISICVNSLVEAKTDQIDNFILPLVTFNTIQGLKMLLA